MTSPLDLVRRIARLLDGLHVAHHFTGSVASSWYGQPRATVDIDVVIDADDEKLTALAAVLEPDFYVSREAMREAIEHHSSFNAISLDSPFKHSGFGAYLGPRIEDREGVLRVARYSARAPVAESRLRYDAACAEVELVSDRNEGPYAGIHRFSALEFIARWVDHVPERYEVRVRYSGAYATRRRVWWSGAA